MASTLAHIVRFAHFNKGNAVDAQVLKDRTPSHVVKTPAPKQNARVTVQPVNVSKRARKRGSGSGTTSSPLASGKKTLLG